MNTRIFLFFIYSIFVFSSYVEAQSCNNDILTETFISTNLGIDSFKYITNERYSGILKIKEHPSQKKLIIIAGRYESSKKGVSTFILLLSCDKGTHFKKEAIFDFYADTIDFVYYKNEKIYVVFKYHTDIFGWVTYIDGNYKFEMFSDQEMGEGVPIE
jgi:hypothetical protein